jgi:hypothetical protein
LRFPYVVSLLRAHMLAPVTLASISFRLACLTNPFSLVHAPHRYVSFFLFGYGGPHGEQRDAGDYAASLSSTSRSISGY